MNIVQNLLDRVESLSIQLGKMEAHYIQAVQKKDNYAIQLDDIKRDLRSLQSDRDFLKKENTQLRQEVQALKDKLYVSGTALAEKLGRESAEKFGWAKNQRIAMIKDLRERAGCGLKEAKEVIDKLVPSEY